MADFSPVAGANSPCDGRVENFSRASWSDAHDATTATGGSTSASGNLMDSQSTHITGDGYSIGRVIINFDTSSIADGDTVTAATLDIYPGIKVNTDADGNDYVVLVTSTPAGHVYTRMLTGFGY